jgi:hypothetical protein
MESSPDGVGGTSPPLHSLKLVARANALFKRLRNAGVDKSGNREFLYSHYASLILLSFFNPALQSLRGLQQASQLKSVQKKLGVGRVSLGSLSESCRVFDPVLLVPLVEELLAELGPGHAGPGPHRHVPETIPQELARRLVAVDGTVLKALPRIVQGGSDWKLHLQFRTLSGLPHGATIAEGEDERDVLAANLEANCVYIADRGYERYALCNQIVAAKSDYVIRGKDRPFAVVKSRPLTAEAQTVRVTADDVVRLSPTETTTRAEKLTHQVRRIVIAKQDRGRVRVDRPNGEEIILLTNLMDVPAEVIAGIYEMRWSIELFFRFLKQVLGCHKLFSTRAEAVNIQIYCALIACLLLARVTGGRIRMDVYRMLCFYIQGLADDDELDECLKKTRLKET